MSGSRGRAPFLFPECLEEHHSGSLCVIYNFPRVPHLSQSRFSGRNSENHRRPERFKGTSFSSNRNQRPSFQSRDRQSRRLSAFVPLSHLRHPEEFRGSSGYSKPQTDQRLHPTSTLQDGDSQCHSAEPLLSGLGGYHRSERRLSTCPYPSGLPASSRFLFPGPDIQLQGPAVRPQGLSLGLHQARGHSHRLPSSSGNSNLLLPRRLADCGDLAGSPPFSSTQNSGDRPEPWVPHQLEEILAEPSTASLLPGRPSRHSPSSRTPPRPPDFRPSCAHSEVDYLPFCSSFSLAETPGPPSQSGGRSSQLQTPHATSTIASQPTFQSFSRPRLSSSTLTSQHQVFGTPVVVPRSSFRGKALLPPPSFSNVDDRCFQVRLGSSPPPPSYLGPLAPTGRPSAHQLPRVTCSPVRPPKPRTLGEGSVGLGSIGQHDGSRVHQPSGRDSLPFPLSTRPGALGVVSPSSGTPLCYPYSGGGELSSGLPLQRELPSDRMDVEEIHIREDLPGPLPSAGDRPFCLPDELPTPQVLLPIQGSSSMESRRDVIPLVCSTASVCLSSDFSNSQSIGEDRPGRSRTRTDSSLLAAETLVPQAAVPSNGPPQGSPVTGGLDHPTPVRSNSSRSKKSTSLSLAAIRHQSKQVGLSDRAATFSAEAIRDSTRATYDSKLQPYYDWCSRIDCDPSSASLGQIADFLISLFDKNLSLSTIRLYRSAIASCHTGFEDGSSVSSSACLSRIMRSFFLKRPRCKTLLPSWSLPAVLKALAEAPFEPLHKASLHHLTLKTVFLVAIASGHRVSTLQALSVDPGHIRWEASGARLIPRADFIAKNQTHSSPLVEIYLPSLSSFSSVSEDKVWCPVRALRWYLDKMKLKRTSSSLFVTHIEPFKSASKSTISRWIVECIKFAGPDAILSDNIRAHDTRSISSSWALFHGATLSDIQSAAFWSSPNTFISCYLKDVPRGEAAFASAVFKAVSRT